MLTVKLLILSEIIQTGFIAYCFPSYFYPPRWKQFLHQKFVRANYIPKQKVGDISLPRNHAPMSRAVDFKFHPDIDEALLLARC